MDLSSLTSGLPPTKLLEHVSVSDLNKDLTDEFKNAAKLIALLYNSCLLAEENRALVKKEFAGAAKAVASLYRLGSHSSVLSMHKGYLDCLDDLLHVIANGEDIEDWALSKRAELTNHYNLKEKVEREADREPKPHGEIKADKSLHKTPERDELESDEGAESQGFSIPVDYEFAVPGDLASTLRFRPSFAPLSVNLRKMKDRRKHVAKRVETASSEESGSDSDSRRRRIGHQEPKRRRMSPH